MNHDSLFLACCRVSGVSPSAIRSPGRGPAAVASSRHIVMWLMRHARSPVITFREIGETIGGRTFGAALRGCAAVDQARSYDIPFRMRTTAFLETVKNEGR